MPTRTDHRAVIRHLLAIWATEEDRKEVELRSDLELQVSVLVRGLAAHAADCARGVLTLYEAGQPIAAVPLIRSLMEDSVTAGWVLVVPDGWKAVLSEGSKARARILREAIEADAVGADSTAEARRQEYEAQARKLGSIPAGYKQFEQRLNALEGTGNMYMLYRYLSALTHAGAETVELYTSESRRSELGVSYRRFAKHSMAANLIQAAATSLTQALTAWDVTQVGRPHESALRAIATELGVDNEWRLRGNG
ncbi:DUF5677 domain-containing protein [Curtobacterium sp. Curtsp57]|uniref:DUF5677 domain-containing protein n=1 Tax=Curtobacterium sp. Curtsp57 TaxID=3243047 RepID=UPI0039B4D91E